MGILEEFGLANPLTAINSGDVFGAIATVLAIAMVIVFILMVYMLIKTFSNYRHRIVVRKLTKTKKLIMMDKFKEFKDDKGIMWYKMMKSKVVLPPAPAESIEITEKGRMFVEVYKDSSGSYIYAKDGVVDEKRLTEAFKPVSTNQRIALVNQIRKAEERRNLGFLNKHAGVIILGTTLLLAIVLLGVFSENIFMPQVAASANFVSASTKLEEVAGSLNLAVSRLAAIETGQTSSPPAQDGGAPR